MWLNHTPEIMNHDAFMRCMDYQERYREYHRNARTLTQEAMQLVWKKFASDQAKYEDWKINRPPEIYEQVHEYPSKWECPKCSTGLTKNSLEWNFLLEENVCWRCGKPQRQFATGKWKDGMKPNP